MTKTGKKLKQKKRRTFKNRRTSKKIRGGGEGDIDLHIMAENASKKDGKLEFDGTHGHSILPIINTDLSTFPKIKEIHYGGYGLKTPLILPPALEKLTIMTYSHYTSKFSDFLSLSNLSDNLKSLTIYGNYYIKDILELPEELPSKLTLLHISQCNLTKLPELPKGLKTLECGQNKLTELPKLPEGLETLQCYGNKLTILQKLPKSLNKFYCGSNLFEQSNYIHNLKVEVDEFHDSNPQFKQDIFKQEHGQEMDTSVVIYKDTSEK